MAAPAPAQRNDADLPVAPPRHFLDAVGMVSAEEAQQFADALYGFEQRTGIQFVMAVLPEHGGELQDFTSRLYEHWRIGNRETQRGVLFLVFPTLRESRLETGYGLEESLPDVVASRILRGMVEVPRDPAAGRLAFVMQEVAGAVAPDDPLATGTGGGPGAGERKSSRGFPLPLLFLLFLILPLVLGGRRRVGAGAGAGAVPICGGR